MVKIINYKEKQTEDKTFCILEIQGGVEMIMNQQTGHYYASAKKARIISTFNKATCELLIGTDIEDRIDKVECEPYEYVSKTTGETMMLSHKYVFVPPVKSTAINDSDSDRVLSNDNSKKTTQEFVDAF